MENLSNILDENDLIDIWRIKNPETKKYTWKKCSYVGTQQSWIDYWFIANSFLYRTKKAEIEISVHSDHSMISPNLQGAGSKKQRGRGFWKLNTSLLREAEYVTRINTLIDVKSNIMK